MKFSLLFVALLGCKFKTSNAKRINLMLPQQGDNLISGEGTIAPTGIVDEPTIQESLVSDTFNTVSDYFLPLFNSVFQDLVLAQFEPYYDLDITSNKNVVGVDSGLCFIPRIRYDYHLGILTGLGKLAVETLAMQDGSERLKLDPFGKSSFSANFDLDLFLDNDYDLMADISGKLKLKACGSRYETSASGDLFLSGTKVGVSMKFGGYVNAWELKGKLEIVDLLDLRFTYEELDTDLDVNFAYEGPIEFNLNQNGAGIPSRLEQPLTSIVLEALATMVPFEFNM